MLVIALKIKAVFVFTDWWIVSYDISVFNSGM